MVKPVKNRPLVPLQETLPKKKALREIDVRVKKAAERQALDTEKDIYAARLRKIEIQRAAVQAQKKAFLAQRAHMAQAAAAARRARAEEKAKKAAERAARKALFQRRTARIRAFLAKPEEKKRSKLFKKYLPRKKKK